jgi:putative peptidoglycan binding protein
VPKALVIDDDTPRRRRSAKPVEVDVEIERNLLMRALLHSPKDTLAGCVALAGVAAIIANAMFMQAGRHPAPMFNTAFPASSAASVTAPASASAAPGLLPRPRPVEAEGKLDIKPAELKPAEPAPAVVKAVPAQVPGHASAVMRPPASIPVATHSDPVGDLIVSTRRIAAVQRALTDFGYGQLKPTGVAGTDTQAAIQKFERERKLPVTGQLSDRLVRELNVVTGRAID